VGSFFVIPRFGATLAGFVTTLPLVTEFTIGLSRTIREFASTPVGAAGVVLCFVAAVATDTTIYSRLAAKDVSQSRRFSIIVSVITLVTLGVMAISLVHPLINLHNDFS
jgi:type II secretory pathway component PulF